MKSILLALGASVILATTAAAQGAQSAMDKALAGTWACSAEGNGMAVTSTTTYVAGGKETFDIAVKGDGGGMQIEFTGSGAADWKFEQGAGLVETISAINIKTAKMNGQDVPAADMQAMVEGMIIGQTTTSTIKIDEKGKEMVLVDTNGVTTNCKR